jgi:hypothetical protein
MDLPFQEDEREFVVATLVGNPGIIHAIPEKTSAFDLNLHSDSDFELDNR